MAHRKWELEIPRFCLSFYLPPNTSDSASFYQRPNIPDTFLGVEMHSSPLELGRKGVEWNVCEIFKYFTQ